MQPTVKKELLNVAVFAPMAILSLQGKPIPKWMVAVSLASVTMDALNSIGTLTAEMAGCGPTCNCQPCKGEYNGR